MYKIWERINKLNDAGTMEEGKYEQEFIWMMNMHACKNQKNYSKLIIMSGEWIGLKIELFIVDIFRLLLR